MAEVALESPDPAASDAAVLERLRAGDEAVFEALVARHYATMLAVAQSYVKGRSVAEEVVQETWLGVIKGLGPLRGSLVAADVDLLDPGQPGQDPRCARGAQRAVRVAGGRRG